MNVFKKAAAAVLCLCALTLTGCFGGLEVNDRAFVQLMGLEKKDGVYFVTLQIYKSESGTADPDVSKANSITESGSGASISSALADAELKIGRRLFLGHIKLLIIGSGIENPSDELALFLDGSVSPSCPTAYSDDPAAAAGTLLEDGSFSAEQVLKLMSAAASQGRTVYASAADVAARTGAGDSAALPCIYGDGESVSFRGLTFARKNGTAGYLAEEDVYGVKLLSGGFECGDKITVPVTVGGSRTAAYITGAKRCLKAAYRDGRLEVNADVHVKIKPAETPAGSSETDTKLIERAVRESVRDTCISAFSTAVWYNSCDIFEIKKLVRRDCPDFYEEYRKNAEKYLAESVLTVNVTSEAV